MFKVNEYFDGNVKSIAFQAADCPATLGVMAPGEYEFGTTTVEFVTVVYGMMIVKLPDTERWLEFLPGETFSIPKDKKFRLKINQDTAYLCLYK